MAQEEKYYIKLYPETFNKCVEKRVPWNQFIIDIEKSIVDGKTIVINQTTGKIEVYENYVASNVINPTDVIFGAKGDAKTKWTYELIRNTLRNYFQSIWDFENIHYYAGIQDRPVIGDINKLYVDTTTEEIFLYYTDAWHTFVASQGVQSDWEEDDQNLQSFIKNKPTKLSQFENDTNFITIGEVPPLPDNIVIDANYVHTDNNYTEGDKQKVDDLSGTNTGDQDLSGLVPRTQNILTKEPTGFSRNDSLVITANGDRTITLSGMVSASYRGDAVTEIVNGYISPQHGTDTTKLYYLYYNGTTISWSDTAFNFELLQICIAKYDNTNARWYYFREAHGFMPWQDHFEFHNNIGTYKSSGGLIPTSSYVLKSTVVSERRIDVNQSLIYDEDLPTVIPALTSKSYTQFALTGAGIDNIGLAKTDIINLLANNPYYNKFTTSWVNTLVPANSVFTVWDYVLPVTADPTSQAYRHLFVQPQWVTQASNPSAGAIATAVTTEKNRLPSELNLNGLLSTEIVAINRITLSYHSGNWRIESVDVLSGNKYSQIGSPSGNYLTSSHLPWASSGHTGTANKLAKWDSSNVAQVSGITELDNGNVGIGESNPTEKVEILGNIKLTQPTNNKVVSTGTSLTLSQLNDAFGETGLEITNRYGQNGAAFYNKTLDLIDFIFRTSTNYQATIRLEHRNNELRCSGNTSEFQVAYSGNLSHALGNAYSVLRGKIFIGSTNTNASSKLHISASDGSANTAQLKLDASRLLSTKEVNTIENDGAKIFFTDLNLIRRAFATEDNFVSYQPNPFYSTGTVSVSGTTVTGVGTSFVALLANNSKIRFSNGEERQITAYTDSTHVTIDRTTGGTVSGATFAIYLKRLFDDGTKLRTIDNEGNVIELYRSINSITAVSSGATYTLLNNRINVLVGSKLLLGNHIFTLEAPTVGIANEIEVEFEIGATLATIAFSQTLSGTIPTWEINAKYQFVIIQQKNYNGDWKYTFKGGKV